MIKLYSLYVILSHVDNNPYIISTHPKELILPFYQINTPNKIKQESRYILRNFFETNSNEFLQECTCNFLDLQEENSIDYMKSIQADFNNENLYITYGGLSRYCKVRDDLFWYPLVFNTEYFGYSTNKALNLLIDNVINKTTL